MQQKVPKCRRCNIPMKKSKALLNKEIAGIPDFEGNTETTVGQTVSRLGKGYVTDCWKCEKCGHSIKV